MTTTQSSQKTQQHDDRPSTMVWPTLSYDDALAAIDFLTTAFGFTTTAVHTDADDPSRVVHAELAWPAGGAVMLGSAPRPEGWPDVTGRGSTYCVTDEVDSLFERAVAAGARVLREPRDEDYGSRDCVVLDPEGNMWSFGTYRGA
ncbi:MAG: VOC family protein [Nocardioidaceae bacterium]